MKPDASRHNPVFPAPAGMNRYNDFGHTENNGVPRASGDEPIGEELDARGALCSPRQRG